MSRRKSDEIASIALAMPFLAFCDTMGIGPSLGWKLIREGKVKSFKLGNKRMIPSSEPARLMEEGLLDDAKERCELNTAEHAAPKNTKPTPAQGCPIDDDKKGRSVRSSAEMPRVQRGQSR